jgi:hypothetical protein
MGFDALASGDPDAGSPHLEIAELASKNVLNVSHYIVGAAFSRRSNSSRRFLPDFSRMRLSESEIAFVISPRHKIPQHESIFRRTAGRRPTSSKVASSTITT